MIYKWLLIASRWGLLYPCACLVKAPQYNTVSGCFSVCEMQSVIFLSNYFTYLKKKKSLSIDSSIPLCAYTTTDTHTRCPREMSDSFHISQKPRKGRKGRERGQWRPFIYWWVKRGEEDQLGANGEHRRRGSVQSFLWRPLLQRRGVGGSPSWKVQEKIGEMTSKWEESENSTVTAV